MPPISYEKKKRISDSKETIIENASSMAVLAKQRLTAIAIAIADSVTVSMGEEMRGVFNVIFLVSADVRS